MPASIQPFDDHRPATEQDIMHFQMGLAAVLPDDYCEFLLRFNGGYPEPVGLGNGSLVNAFFGFCQKSHCLQCNYYIHRTVFPFGIIPIADDPGGNIICIVLSKPDHGKILFWDHEQGDADSFSILADSFSTFLDSLCELPDK